MMISNVMPVTTLTHSQKTAETENFPVASLFLSEKVRAEVMDFYYFARKADDIADYPDLSLSAKKTALHEMQQETENPYLLDLLKAFLIDCEKTRYQSWEDLIGYCELSANPVGRFLLDVHGCLNEDTQKASDALCTVLQITNHLQDCQKDFREMNRIYLPREMLKAECTFEDELSQDKTSDELQSVFDQCHLKCRELIMIATPLAGLIPSKRLRMQAKVTHACALKLLEKLEKGDPLAKRLELSKWDKATLLIKGILL